MHWKQCIIILVKNCDSIFVFHFTKKQHSNVYLVWQLAGARQKLARQAVLEGSAVAFMSSWRSDSESWSCLARISLTGQILQQLQEQTYRSSSIAHPQVKTLHIPPSSNFQAIYFIKVPSGNLMGYCNCRRKWMSNGCPVYKFSTRG